MEGEGKPTSLTLPEVDARYRTLVEQIPAVVFMAFLGVSRQRHWRSLRTIMIARGELELETDIESDTAPLNSLVREMLESVKHSPPWTMGMETSFTSVSVFSLLGQGLIFGLKHATEVDHIVAVSTIVSEHRSLIHSALVGALWGLGQTAALVIVGALCLCFVLLYHFHSQTGWNLVLR
jgi:hypothetical protein